MVAQTRTAGHNTQKKLKFNEKLVNKGLSTDALLKKLKVLHTELAEMDQELVDVNSLGSARKELVSTSILLHKDRGVKALAACCLADILRLYAPDAPYTQNELRDIFSFFFRQLVAGFTGPDASYYDEYFHLLESLSTVKSVVLVCDLPNADELMVGVFRDCFALVRRSLAKKVEMFLADILVALIDECQSLPGDVLETLMTQFTDKNARMDQPSFRLAVQVCNATADKLQRHVCQYFTDIIVSHSEEEYEDIRTAHELIRQLHRFCPALLHSVLPQLEEELRAEDVQLRQIVTQVLGEMLADKGGGDLVKKYPSTWNLWLHRKNDKSPVIRIKFVEATRGLLAGLVDQRELIEDALSTKLLDPDEKVRAAVCRVYSQIDYETALHHVSESQLRALAGRGVDKKHHVRVEALNSLGHLYSLAYPEIENNDAAAIKQFSWIPSELLHMATVGLEVKLEIERILGEFVFPFPSVSTGTPDEIAWTDRLLNIMRYLDDAASKSLLSMLGLKVTRPSIYEHFIQCCVQNNGGIIDENEEIITRKLTSVIQHLAGTFPDPQKASEDLRTFAKLNEGRLYKLAKTCMDTQSDLKSVVKATTEFLKRLEQSSLSIVPTMSTFLRRASLHYVNQSSIPTLVKRVEQEKEDPNSITVQHARTLLSFASKHCPSLYKAHIAELIKSIANEGNPTLVEICLQALSAVVKWDPKLAVWDKRTTERIMRYATGSNHRHAKFAARLIAFHQDRETYCEQAMDTIAESLQTSDHDTRMAYIAALDQFARLAPAAFETRSGVVMAFLLKKVLMVPIRPDPNKSDANQDWYEEYEMPPELKARILCLKVCRNRCLAHAASQEALDISRPTIKLLISALDDDGAFSAGGDDDVRAKSRLKLQATVSLLHLCTVESYANVIASKFTELALTVQHPVYHVRMIFLTKLISLLTPRKLSPRFNVIPFLTVHDPDQDVKNTAIAYVSHMSKSLPAALKVEHLELIFVRLLHLLAHHPDFALSHDKLSDIARCIEFYLELIATADTVSLLYHLAMKTKTVRDAVSHSHSENLYAVGELAQEIIKARAPLRGWSIESYPGKVKLPSDILKPLPNAETARKVLRAVYLPEDTAAWLTEITKSQNAAATKEKRRMERKVNTAKRKATAPKKSSEKKRSRNTKRWQSDATEEDEDDEEEEAEASADEMSDVEASPPKRTKTATPSSEADGSAEGVEKEEKLGRGGTRTKAKRL